MIKSIVTFFHAPYNTLGKFFSSPRKKERARRERKNPGAPALDKP
jgi:hypothetical protein